MTARWYDDAGASDLAGFELVAHCRRCATWSHIAKGKIGDGCPKCGMGKRNKVARKAGPGPLFDVPETVEETVEARGPLPFTVAVREARARHPVTRRDGRWWIGDLDFDTGDEAREIQAGLIASSTAELMGLDEEIGDALCDSAMAGLRLTAALVREAADGIAEMRGTIRPGEVRVEKDARGMTRIEMHPIDRARGPR